MTHLKVPAFQVVIDHKSHLCLCREQNAMNYSLYPKKVRNYALTASIVYTVVLIYI